jgi:hypothetical protein
VATWGLSGADLVDVARIFLGGQVFWGNAAAWAMLWKAAQMAK